MAGLTLRLAFLSLRFSCVRTGCLPVVDHRRNPGDWLRPIIKDIVLRIIVRTSSLLAGRQGQFRSLVLYFISL